MLTKSDAGNRAKATYNQAVRKTLFPLAAKMMQRGKKQDLEDLKYLVSLKYGLPTDPNVPAEDRRHLAFFLNNRQAIAELASVEMANHYANGNYESAYMMPVFMDNTLGMLNAAIKNGNIEDWMVAVAPMVARSVWKRVCVEYARQLEGKNQIHKAVTYLLAIDKIPDGVLLFRKHKLFREAILLARARLSETDPLIRETLMDWCEHCKKEGNVERAVRCFLAAGMPLEAARLMATKPDAAALSVSCTICANSGLINEAAAYAKKCFESSLQQYDWVTAAKVAGKVTSLNSLLPPVKLHRSLIVEYRFSSEEAGEDTLAFPGKLFGSQAFIAHSALLWEQDVATDPKTLPQFELDRLYKQLEDLEVRKQEPKTERHLEYKLAMEMAMHIQSVFCGKIDQAFRHVAALFKMPWEAESLAWAEFLAPLLLPRGPRDLSTLFPASFKLPDRFSSAIGEPMQAWYSLCVLISLVKKMEVRMASVEKEKEQLPQGTPLDVQVLKTLIDLILSRKSKLFSDEESVQVPEKIKREKKGRKSNPTAKRPVSIRLTKKMRHRAAGGGGLSYKPSNKKRTPSLAVSEAGDAAAPIVVVSELPSTSGTFEVVEPDISIVVEGNKSGTASSGLDAGSCKSVVRVSTPKIDDPLVPSPEEMLKKMAKEDREKEMYESLKKVATDLYPNPKYLLVLVKKMADLSKNEEWVAFLGRIEEEVLKQMAA